MYSDLYYDDLMVRMAHHSTAIEGNSLSQGETKSILIDRIVPRVVEMRELYEVENYGDFMPVMLADVANKIPIDIELIKKYHELLCKKTIEHVPGKFKVVPNNIVGADFTPTPPYRVLTDLEEWRRNLVAQMEYAQDNDAIVEVICRQHLVFERIHPFPDGNGRVGRALMVYMCLLYGITPIVITKELRKEYMMYLNTANIAGMVAFCKRLQSAEQERIASFA
ncbi:Fic family protein [Phascolarctobacterium sp.]|uniref:Fic family protein n=1 Tax=Phascolarctobacterium sp. TaxID=2049039 RepID=UPI003867283B